SYTNFDIKDIYAPNRTLIIEDEELAFNELLDKAYYTSFRVPNNCYVENISIRVSTTINQFLEVRIYNASWDGTYLKYSVPNTAIKQITNVNHATPLWENIINWHQLLDPSKTDNNTFFVRVRSELDGNANWYEGSDGVYDSIVWAHNGLTPELGIDMALKIGLSPINETPSPEQIKLKFNGKPASGYGDNINYGYWESTAVNGSASGELQYIVLADWWDVTCNVSHVQINFTKTDLISGSLYNIPGSDQSLDWNCPLGVIDNFDVRLNNYEINFTIPATWENFTAFNGTIDKTSDINLGAISKNYRELQILNADNGSNWYITAQSENLLHTIHTYVNAVDLSTMDFTDTINFIANFSKTISDGMINLSVYSPAPNYYLNHSYIDSSIVAGSELSLGNWKISDNVTEYGVFKVQVKWYNGTAGGFLEKDITIMGVTDLILNSPISGQDLFSNYIFNITVFYNDTGLNSGDQGIPGQQIEVNTTILGWTDKSNGYYNIEINSSDYSFGWNYIEIEAYDTYYHNASIIFSFHLKMNTTISPSDFKDFGDIIRGQVVQYEFNYSDILGTPITAATLDIIKLDVGFTPGSSITENIGEPGNYTIELDTTNVDASIIPYECKFNITKIGKETQIIIINLTVILSQSDIDIIDSEPYLIKKDGLNQTVLFYFNDTDNNIPITGLPVDDVRVKDNQTGLPRTIWLYPNGTDGYYILNISIVELNSGWIELLINITFEPNYATISKPVIFYYQGNLTQTHLISVSDPGGEGTLKAIGNNYTCFIGRDLLISFNITDIYNSDSLVMGVANSYLAEYVEVGNPGNQGSISQSLNNATTVYEGTIDTSDINTIGTYEITIKVFKTDFETSILNFNLTLRALYTINISVVDAPTQITAGDSFHIIVLVKYYNTSSSNWFILSGCDVRVTANFGETPGTPSSWAPTNNTGEVEFEILTSNTIRNITLTIEVQSEFYHEGDMKNVYNIKVNPLSAFNFEDLLPYLIMIGVAAVAIASSVGIYKGVVVPKKKEKSRILTEVKTIFDDAINL
ncbi:MAG: hypothetical protein ACFFDF_14100, partial [Candidatus Odinarchaeota archaeon]